jgi:hypothetical protein
VISIPKRFFEINYFIANVLVPVAVLALYCGSFAYFSSRFLLEGVNYFFVTRLGKYLLLFMAMACLVLPGMYILKKGRAWGFKYPAEKFYASDLLLLLLPLTPVFQYTLNNQDILSPLESFYVLVFFVFFSGLYMFAVPALLRRVASTRTLMIMGLAFAFTIISMASISDYFRWFEQGTLKKQAIFFAVVFLLAWLLYNFNYRGILYLFVVANFVVNSSAQLLTLGGDKDGLSLPAEQNKLQSMIGERTPAVAPNIYLLVYDAYVANETMLAYGIDNSSQEAYLNEQGFELYPHTYSIGAATLETMSKVLNASTEYYGDHRRGVSGDGVVQNKLSDLGYETYGLFYTDYMFRGIGESYDYSIPEHSNPQYIELIKAILIGEFRFDLGDEFRSDLEFEKQPRYEFVETKQMIFEGVSDSQVFIYMHSNLPSHSQNSGACLPNETDLFRERLMAANVEMRQDLETIIENDPSAIIIVAGDHGPGLTKNCDGTSGFYDISEISRLDIQDRYGTFLAIRWPTDDFVQYDDITVLQDLFPAIFAYLYEDVSILESKIEPAIPTYNSISGASVKDGVIYGGIDDGEPLFLSGN